MLEYTAVDNYGDPYLLSDLSELTILSSNNTIVDETKIAITNISGVDYLTFDTEDIAANGEVTLTAIVTATGATSQTTFTVYADPRIDAVTLSKPANTVYAVGDTAAIINITAVDQYGTPLTNAEIGAAASAGLIALSSSNQAVVPQSDLDAAAVIGNDGTITIDLSGGNIAGKTTIFAQVGTNIEQFEMEVKPARRPDQISVVTEPAAEILQGENTIIRYALTDQYGRGFDRVFAKVWF